MVAIVQSKFATGELPFDVTLDDPPTPGNVLVAVAIQDGSAWPGGNSGAFLTGSDPGWTAIPNSFQTIWMPRFGRIVEVGDGATWGFAATDGSTVSIARIALFEFSDARLPEIETTGGGGNSTAMTKTPTIPSHGMYLHVAGFASGGGSATPVSGMAEVDETAIAGTSLVMWVGTKSPDGSLATVGANLSSAANHTNGFLIIPPRAYGWDVYDGADPNGPILATLERAYARKIRPELNGTGRGELTISRHDAQATAAIFKRGNIVKVRMPELDDDYLFAWIIEEGDFALLSPDEDGGEELRFGGRGGLAYLDRARMWSQAFTTGMDVSDTWTQIWESAGVTKPSGSWYDAADDKLNVIDQVTRRRYQTDQATRVATAVSGPLFSEPALGLSGDPSDPGVYWTLAGNWPSGGSLHTKIRRHDKATNAILDTFDMGSAMKLTSIKCSGSFIWATRYDVSDNLYAFDMSDGSLLSTTTVVYDGVTQLKPTGVSFLGTSLLIWYEGTGRALKVSEASPSVVIGVITAADLPALGADWSSEGGQEFIYPVSVLLGKTFKYQVTSAVPHDPVDGIWRLDEPTPGAILNRIISECQHGSRPQAPLPDLTRAFDYDLDSDGVAWAPHDGTIEYDARIGDSVLAKALGLVPYGITLQMSPRLVLGAHGSYGQDRTGPSFGTGVVRFEKGVNLAEGLRRQMASRELDSHLLAQGDAGLYALAEDDDLGFVQEGFLPTNLADATALAGTAEAELARQRRVSEALALSPAWGDDEAAGRYLPKRHYWLGDLVRLHTGDGAFEYDEADVRIFAITLTEADNGEWLPVVDVQEGAYGDVGVRLGGSGGGSSSGSAPAGGGGGTTTIGPQTITVRGLDDTGAITSSAVGRTIESPDIGAWQKSDGVIGLSVLIRGGHTHASEEFTAAGGSPETFTLAETPTGTRRVFKNGVRLPTADVGGAGDEVEITTAASDVVTVDYEVAL